MWRLDAEEVYRSFVEPLPQAIDLDAFDDAITEILASTPKWDSGAIDPRAAVEIHRTLPLSRCWAADWGVWRCLAVIHRPDFIRHRWEFQSWATNQATFWQRGTRPDSNTIGRLWWVVELSTVGGDYSLTRRVLVTQSLTKSIFIRTLSDYPVEVLENEPTKVAQHVLLRLHRNLSTMPLEGMTREEFVAAMRGGSRNEEKKKTLAHNLRNNPGQRSSGAANWAGRKGSNVT